MVVQLVLCLQHLPFFMSQLSCSSFLPSFLCTENIACAQHCPSASSFGKSNREKYISGSGVPFSVLVTETILKSRTAFLCYMLHQEG